MRAFALMSSGQSSFIFASMSSGMDRVMVSFSIDRSTLYPANAVGSCSIDTPRYFLRRNATVRSAMSWLLPPLNRRSSTIEPMSASSVAV